MFHRKRSNSIVRGHLVEPNPLEVTPVPSAVDLSDIEAARRRTVVLQISKKNLSLIDEFKSVVEVRIGHNFELS